MRDDTSMARTTPNIDPVPNREQLQELYSYLDHTSNGNTYFAWYAQLRAQEHSHRAALLMTIEHFRLADQEWFQLRNLPIIDPVTA